MRIVRDIVVVLCLLCVVMVSVHAQPTQYFTQDKKAIKLYKEAIDLLKRVQFYDAENLLKTAVSRDPNFIEGWLSLGSIQKRIGNDSSVFACYTKAIEIDPDYKKSKTAYFTIGEI